MRNFCLIGLAMGALALSACAYAEPPPSTAVMPPGALGTNGDIDIRALDVAAFAFAQTIRNDPAAVADAVAALDYMGGELNSNPRWIDTDPLTRAEMLEARQTIRSDIGISQAASSQAVVDTMLALAQAYRASDQAGVERLLANPIFIEPPAAVQAHLDDLPRMPAINSATTKADGVLPDGEMTDG